MEAIAERAGVTRMTVYLRHPTKAALLRATIEDRVKRWSRAGHRKDWLDGNTLEKQLINFGRQLLLWSANEEVAATRRLVEGGSREALQAAQELDFAIREPVVIQLAEEIAQHRDNGEFACEDPREIALVFIGMLEAIWRSAPEAPPQDLLGRVDKLVAILLRGQGEW